MQTEVKGDSLNNHVDFGCFGLLDHQFWVNPYFAYGSSRKMDKRKWTMGFVGRWNNLLARCQVAMAGLDEKIEAGLTTQVSHRGEWLHDNMMFRWVAGSVHTKASGVGG
jgi:hypothetical protein